MSDDRAASAKTFYTLNHFVIVTEENITLSSYYFLSLNFPFQEMYPPHV